MPWAVHNLAAPAVEIDDHGTMTLDGQTRITLPEPLATFDTFDLAEEWREARLAEMKGEGR
ncbi:hypothetical protein [Sphingopyxis sp. 550A]